MQEAWSVWQSFCLSALKSYALFIALAKGSTVKLLQVSKYALSFRLFGYYAQKNSRPLRCRNRLYFFLRQVYTMPRSQRFSRCGRSL